jgi:hypothetical protein
MWIQIAWGPSRQHQTDTILRAFHEPGKCRERSFEEAAGASGSVPMYFDRELAATLFPNLMRRVPPMQLAALLATTRLVGMECPGLHSIYSGLNLAFFSDCDGVPELNYHAVDGNQRLALLLMDVDAPGMRGQIKIFYRPTPLLDMGEYAAAKMAGEILCEFLQKASPGIAIHKPRLPRVATDQTVSLLPVNNQCPLSVLLAHLRYLRQLTPHE